jgi:poly(A) polymerase
MLEQPRFRAGFDFLRLRAQTGEIDIELAEWWEKFSTAYDDERHAMIEAMRLSQLQKPQQARVRVKRQDTDGASTALAAAPGRADVDQPEQTLEQGEFAPAKKRRRRRKPGGKSEHGDASADGAPGERPSGAAASD